MLRRFRDQVGTAGFVISIVALIAAFGGGAYAASGGLTAKQKKEVKAIAKQFAGKPGTAGANGTNGPPGDKGAPGANGSNGSSGANGKSVETGAATVAECPEGGATVQVAGEAATKKKICNGEEGPQGPEGSPWAAGGTLPSGKKETGAWAIGTEANENFALYDSISFTLPLASSVKARFVNAAGEEVIESSGTPATVCLGSAANPTAPAGNLCIYEQAGVKTLFESAFNPEGGPANFAGKGGVNIVFYTEPGGTARGDWAVTAP